MDKQIRDLTRLNTIRDIELALMKSQNEGMIIPEIVYEVIKEVEASYNELPPEVINEITERD